MSTSAGWILCAAVKVKKSGSRTSSQAPLEGYLILTQTRTAAPDSDSPHSPQGEVSIQRRLRASPDPALVYFNRRYGIHPTELA